MSDEFETWFSAHYGQTIDPIARRTIMHTWQAAYQRGLRDGREEGREDGIEEVALEIGGRFSDCDHILAAIRSLGKEHSATGKGE